MRQAGIINIPDIFRVCGQVIEKNFNNFNKGYYFINVSYYEVGTSFLPLTIKF